MATRDRPRDRALADAHRDAARMGDEIRSTRRAAGLSIGAAAASVGLDPSTYGRLERGQLRNPRVDQVALAAASVGRRLVLRSYLVAEPVRDAGHLRLLARFRARLPADVAWATEVPLPSPGDLRALDGWIRIGDQSIGVEAETRLGDLQAIQRRAALKKRDARLDRMILLVADTRANRDVLALHGAALRTAFPLETRAVLRALAAPGVPSDDGLVVL